MKQFFALCTAISLVCVMTFGCEAKKTTEVKSTVTTPEGSTTTTDTHKVESTGNAPPANAAGETAK